MLLDSVDLLERHGASPFVNPPAWLVFFLVALRVRHSAASARNRRMRLEFMIRERTVSRERCRALRASKGCPDMDGADMLRQVGLLFEGRTTEGELVPPLKVVDKRTVAPKFRW